MYKRIGRRLPALAALLLAAWGRPSEAATGYYLVNVYSDPGRWTLDYKYWNAKASVGPPIGSPELGIGYGVNSRWYTELYGVTQQDAVQGTQMLSMNWQNDVLLTQGEYPFDLAIHTDVGQYRNSQRDGYSLGPVHIRSARCVAPRRRAGKARVGAGGGATSPDVQRGQRAFWGQPSGRGRQASPAVVAAPCRGTTTARRCA